jgi:hypothetical protein
MFQKGGTFPFYMYLHTYVEGKISFLEIGCDTYREIFNFSADLQKANLLYAPPPIPLEQVQSS